MKISRAWAMPNGETFQIKPIAEFIDRWIAPTCVDPFARNSKLACITNDLNPETEADHHLDVFEFGEMLHDQGISPRSILFDPPYSARQAADLYKGIGVDAETLKAVRLRKGNSGTRTGSGWSLEKDLFASTQERGGFFLSFGWNSSGMGKKRGYEIREVLLVAHGAGRNDTICTCEEKVSE